MHPAPCTITRSVSNSQSGNYYMIVLGWRYQNTSVLFSICPSSPVPQSGVANLRIVVSLVLAFINIGLLPVSASFDLNIPHALILMSDVPSVIHGLRVNNLLMS